MEQPTHRKAHYSSILTIVPYFYVLLAHLLIHLWAELPSGDALVSPPSGTTTIRSRIKKIRTVPLTSNYWHPSTSKSTTDESRKTSVWMSSTQRNSVHVASSFQVPKFKGINVQKPIVNNSTSPSTITPLIPPLEEDSSKSIKHVAFICDGNSRWGQQHDAPSWTDMLGRKSQNNKNSKSIESKQQSQKLKGHMKGAKQVISLIEHIRTHHPHIQYVTIYGFSSENWSRSSGEIRGIFQVIEQTTRSIKDWVLRKDLRIQILGDYSDDRVPSSLRTVLRELEADSCDREENNESGPANGANNGVDQPLTLCLAINYGGRNDIIDATRKIAQLIKEGKMEVDDVNTDTFENFLCTSGIPDPDLVVRTGGEKRLSNFLIWNCAYAELYFTDVLWPDFGGEEMDLAVDWYYGRDRRFGGRSDSKNDDKVNINGY